MIKYLSPFICFALLTLIACEPAAERSDAPEPPTTAVEAQEEPAGDRSEQKKKTILFFGNSLTAAYGLDVSQGFPDLIQEKLDSLGLPYRTINAGLSGETTAGGLSRIDWILEQQAIDVFVLELGGNDGLRGLDPAASRKNLQGIIDKVRAKYPEAKILIAGMEAPPNMGQSYTREFRNIYTGLAAENELPLIPFLLEGVGGVPELNQRDGIHPTAEGHRIVAETVWKKLRGLLKNSPADE